MDTHQQKLSPIQIISLISRLEGIILNTFDYEQVVSKVVDSILYELDSLHLHYRIVVLGLVDEKHKILRRKSVTYTKEAKIALKHLAQTFHSIEIPLTANHNYCIRALNEQRPLITHDWTDILTPPFASEDARRAQEESGIKTSVVFPLVIRQRSTGIMIFSMTKEEEEVSYTENQLLTEIVDMVALAIQNSLLYNHLKQSKQNLEKAYKQLKSLDTMKNDFIAMTSHDLRTPLTIIRGNLWMALHNKSGAIRDPEIRHYVQTSLDATEHMMRLVNNTLTVSLIEAGHMALQKTKQAISDVVHIVIDEFNLLKKAHKITINVHEPSHQTPPFMYDKDRIKEVLVNLVANAFHYTPDKGTISIDIRERNKESGHTTRGEVVISVKDSGRGIDRQYIDTLFTKFGYITGHTPYKVQERGTGLGLYISKQIVELHGGNIWVDSHPQKGSTFAFSLPTGE